MPNGIKIKIKGEGEWRRHGVSKRRVWRKIRLGTDEETLAIRAVEVTSGNVGNAPMLPELLARIPPGGRDHLRHRRKCPRHARLP
ncbi:hypothetical protein JMM62_09715 [Rhodovulum sulfidophilum]|nr:hypothetical protein [Rhodovulum sulfidophilum]